MKMLIGLFAIVLSLSSFASTVDTETFVYDGSVDSVELLLNAEKTHTEYRTEQVRRTCYRTEIVGYRTVCTGGYSGPRGPRTPRHCYQQPVYRQIPYTCIETVSIPYEVKDYDVDARVIIDVTNLSEQATPGETFKVTLNGDSLTFNAIGSKKFFIVKKVQDIRSSMNGSVKLMDAILAVDLVEASPILKSIDLNNISLSESTLSFKTGVVTKPEYIGYELDVRKSPRLGSDTVLFDRALVASELNVSSNGETSINLDNLNVKIGSGRHKLSAKIFVKLPGSLLNSSQFEELSASKTLIYKN